MAGSPVSHEREGLFDAVMIPRMIEVLSERFDPAGRLLLFCESAKLRLHAPCRWAQLSNLAKNSLD